MSAVDESRVPNARPSLIRKVTTFLHQNPIYEKKLIVILIIFSMLLVVVVVVIFYTKPSKMFDESFFFRANDMYLLKLTVDIGVVYVGAYVRLLIFRCCSLGFSWSGRHLDRKNWLL
jgi:hypothetical protein